MSLRTIKKFIVSVAFISELTAVVAVINGINYIYSSLTSTLNLWITAIGVIILIFLMYLTYIRFILEQKVTSIKKYVSLMNTLQNLSYVNSNSNKIVLETLEHPTIGEALLWKKYFDTKIRKIERNFKKLNTKFDKFIDNPYSLLRTDCTIIKEQFIELAMDTKKYYEDFSELVTTKNIHPINNKFKEIKDEYEDFINELNKSENNEIKKDVPKYLLVSLSLSAEEWISPYAGV